MNYDMKSPCDHCPFRIDIPPYLTTDRIYEIADSLVRGEFPCHKTTVADEETDEGDMWETPNSQHCAGALRLMEAAECPSQMMRIAGRLGIYDPRKIDKTVPVYESWDEMAEAQER